MKKHFLQVQEKTRLAAAVIEQVPVDGLEYCAVALHSLENGTEANDQKKPRL